MAEIQLTLNAEGQGGFFLYEENKKVAEMIIGISGANLTVYHTEVIPEYEGKGLAKELLNAMVDYARTNHLNVITLCPFVHVEFSRHPDEYNDIWKK